MEARRRTIAARPAWWAAALIPLLLGLALRLYYLFQAEPFVDEPTTLLAAQAVARSGWPLLPSGLFYGNDLVYTYLAGLLVAVAGADLAVLRALSLVASLATIALVYRIGWRAIERHLPGPARELPWSGLWAALLLALSPAAIIWGGRARAYALLQLLVLLAAWLFYRGLPAGRAGRRHLGWLTLVAAVYVHPEAGLLLPALVVAAALMRGWRWWLRPARLVELALATVAVSSRFWWQMVLAGGRIGGFETATGSRPPLEVVADLPARLGAVLPFFVEGERLIWTLLALAATGWAVARGRRKGWRQPILFFATCLWSVPLGMVLVLGSTYQSPRYLTMLLPIFALLAAGGLRLVVTGLARLVSRPRWQMGLAALASVLLLLTGLPGAVAASASREKGFRSAFETVAAHWQPGDRLATVAPAYAQVVLGRCDYFSLGLDYEEFVYRAGDGTWRDRWLGVPLIRSAGELASRLDAGERLWLVVDEGRLRRRFAPAFAQLAWQRLALVAKIDDVFVFGPYEATDPAVTRPLAVVFGNQIALSAYDLGLAAHRPADPGWGEVVVRPGDLLPLTLYWQAAGPIAENYTVFVHLLAADGQRYAQADGPPLAGIQPMTHWQPGEILPDRRTLELPADLPPGRYRLEVGLYEPGEGDRLPVTGDGCGLLAEAVTLDYVRLPAPGEALPASAGPPAGDLRGAGDALRLLDHSLATDVARPGDVLPLSLTWQALAPVGADYTVFVHLLGAGDQIWGQGDGPPLAGAYPTCFWDPGEIVVDERAVEIAPDAPAGAYRLAVGFYVLDSGRRLLAEDGGRLIVGQVEITP